MVKYIKKADGKMAGSIGDGRDSVPTPGTVNARTPGSIGALVPALDYALSHLDSSGSFSFECDTCGEHTQATKEEIERLGRGWRGDCDSCTDPSREAEYGLLECVECGAEAYGCSCENGPVYCTADECISERGDLSDDGLCDFCGEVATSVDDFPNGCYHVCDACSASDDTDSGRLLPAGTPLPAVFATVDGVEGKFVEGDPRHDSEALVNYLFPAQGSLSSLFDDYDESDLADAYCDECGLRIGSGTVNTERVCAACKEYARENTPTEVITWEPFMCSNCQHFVKVGNPSDYYVCGYCDYENTPA
jgi:hypothetical protein